MTRQQAREELNRRSLLEFYPIEKSKGENKYICPICSSGTGKNKTGALHHYPDSNRWKCFACDAFGDKGQDVLGALRALWELDETETLAKAGYTIDRESYNSSNSGSWERWKNLPKQAAATPQTALRNDYTSYYDLCRANLLQSEQAISYLKARGISTDTATAYNVGFDAQADPAGAGHPTARLILPTCKSHYVARAIDESTPAQFKKMNNKGGKPAIFNASCLNDSSNEAIFVTEGFFDALSILEVGAAAIALNSTSNTGMLLEQLQSKRTAATLILCLDNDGAGKKATDTLKQGLQRLNISYITADICGSYKDPNEALTGDKAAFIEAIQHAQRQTAARPDNVSSYIDTIMTGEIDQFKESKDRKTGFANLDALAGGLYSGLYVVAAISSLGKTTFSHQIADQLAEMGEDVLFFSLEQSRLELVSKSLARRTAQADASTAVNSLSIRRGYLPQQVLTAAAEYKKAISDRLSIIEGNFACNISFIGDYIRKYIQKTGKKPVVFIDYLQILQPEKDERGKAQTTKETVDTTVTELKRISREQGLTIFVISSVNRSNYLTPIDFESLKESGGIEYTADVIWGLQLQVMNDPIFSSKEKIKDKREKVKQAKAETPRKIELVCLKNRYGIASFSAYFDYYPQFDLYKEDTNPKYIVEEKTASRR